MYYQHQFFTTTVKQLEKFYIVLEAGQTKLEEHKKQIDNKIEQLSVAIENLTKNMDNLIEDYVQNNHNLEKGLVDSVSTMFHTFGILPTPPGPLQIGTSSTF